MNLLSFLSATYRLYIWLPGWWTMYVVLCQVGFDLYFYMIWYIWIQILYSFHINGWCRPVLIAASRGVIDVVLCHCRIVPCRTFQKVVQRGSRQFPSTGGQNSDAGGAPDHTHRPLSSHVLESGRKGGVRHEHVWSGPSPDRPGMAARHPLYHELRQRMVRDALASAEPKHT